MKGLWSEHFPTAADKPTTAMGDNFPWITNGLWSDHFPAADEPVPPPPPSHQYQQCLLCPKCNAAICRLYTSATLKNPGRQFYKCPALDHKFFKWADEVKPDQFIDVPNCGGCSAGVCRVRRETIGPNAGRILFMCRVKEGEGSCGYRVWQDELEISGTGQADERISSSQPSISCDDISATNTDLDEGADIVTPMIKTPEHLLCPEIISLTIGQLKYQEDKPNESSRRPYKRSRYGDVKASGSLISAHPLKVRLSVNSVPIKHSWIEDAIHQNLSNQLHGWWGRLAFHPMPCLMIYASKSFTCYKYFFSPLESTFVVQDQILVNNIESTTLTRGLGGVESYNKPLLKLKKCYNTLDYTPVVQDKILVNSSDSSTVNWSLLGAESYSKPLFSPYLCQDAEFSGDVMSKSISSAFCQAAERLQNDLLTFLETMDVKDHEAMRQAAETTFAALGHLLFDHQDFKRRVKELIHSASLLSEIEQSIPTNDSYQRLIEHCSSERMRLEEINRVHAEATDTVTNNKKRLQVLQEEISTTMNWLFQIEAEISCCEVEMRDMELELGQISRNKEELEGKYLIASKELEESQKIFEQKEAERKAAKAAFDRARALLRG